MKEFMRSNHSSSSRIPLGLFLLGLTLLSGTRAEQAMPNLYPFSTVAEAFRAAGFDPNAPGHSRFVVCSDWHQGQNGNDLTRSSNELAGDLKEMDPPPAFLLFDGDTRSWSTAFR